MATARDPRHRERIVLGVIAACCVGPMLLIVLLTAVLGVTLGPAAAISIGLVAAAACIVLMIARHRDHPAEGADHEAR